MTEAEKTNIQWTDFTWNPWVGCNHVSPGCDNCYMFSEQSRRNKNPKEVVKTTTVFDKPLKRDRQKQYKIPDGSKVFVCSYSDFFHPVADQWRDEAWDIIRQRPGVIFQIVTKRTSRMRECLPEDWGDGWPNVWLIVSVENSEMLPRVDKLLNVPAAVRGVSYEPALDFVDFRKYLPYTARKMQSDLFNSEERLVCHLGGPGRKRLKPKLDWIIVGGESGDGARPFQMSWAAQTVKDCKDAGVACFVKQMGSQPMSGNEYITTFKHSKGGEPSEWPRHLQVQEFPKGNQ